MKAALLACLLLAQSADTRLHLVDGRVLHGHRATRDGKVVRLKTAFGTLVVPADKLAGTGTDARSGPPAADAVRVRKTKWLLIESDLSEERAKLYADQLDSFFDWMVKVYALDLDRTRRDAPYRMRVFRRRADFKRTQREVAPGIDKKGKAFAEGVAGFYAARLGRIFLWDAEGARGGIHLEVAKHETTHLLNHLLAQQRALKVPTWFEEGAATYFSMFVAVGAGAGAGASEPEDHPGAITRVVGEIEARTALQNRALRGVGWAKFLGREYSWGWAMVRFFRHHKKGRRWPELLDFLRTIDPRGNVTDSEDRRFLKAAGFKSNDAFDKAWHAHLIEAKPAGRGAPIGTSPEVLTRVATIKKPDQKLARNFARIGASLARSHIAGPAIVYLRAALRGGVEEAYVPHLLARAIARKGRLTDGEPWPTDALDALGLAVKQAPLRAVYRRDLGRQLLAHGRLRMARDTLGLALVLAGPDDDDIAIALALLDAATRLAPGKEPESFVEDLGREIPPARDSLRIAYVYLLQAREDWGALMKLLERRVEKGEATFEQRAMLAGLYKASDSLDSARDIYAGLLQEKPSALRFWPDLIECLLGSGDRAAAREAKARALEALRKDPRDLGWIRRRLERLETD